MLKAKMGVKRRKKTKFEEYVEMDMKPVDRFAMEDLMMEKRLAKKLKMKSGKLREMDDEMDLLLEGIPSLSGSVDANEDSGGDMSDKKEKKEKKKKNDKKKKNVVMAENDDDVVDEGLALDETSGDVVDVAHVESGKKRRKRKKSKKKQEESNPAKPEGNDTTKEEDGDSDDVTSDSGEMDDRQMALQETTTKYIAPHLRARAANESQEHTQVRRRVRGLLNRLSESNVESITAELTTIFRSVNRSIGSQIISEEVLAACSGGPRGNEQYAAVFAAFTAGMAASVGMDFSAKLMASLAKQFEDEYCKQDNLSLRNLTLLLSYLCVFEVCSSDLIYDFLNMLSKRLTEIDVSTILSVLHCCGIKIRGDDPTAMKNFIQSVQSRVNELKVSSNDGQANINGKRMEFMLETICDIKNNKTKPKEETVQFTRIKKWLQKLKAEDIVIRGLTWSKLLDPNKKGQWWLSGDMTQTTNIAEEVASTIDRDVLEAQNMLQLAASQRMNTDTRKGIFCIIMSGEDYVDAFVKLLRLNLSGKQDREIMRVLVQCCMGEKVFNKYYTVLASKLCEHDKNHKKTLQFCLWDHFKQLESLQLSRSMNLAKFVVEMVASFTLSLGILKIADFADVSQLTPKRIIHLRMLFDTLFEYPDKVVWNAFTRLAINPELESLRLGIQFFVKEYVVKDNNDLASKFKLAKKALNNVEGVLM